MKKLFILSLVLFAALLATAQSDWRTVGTLTASSSDCSTAGSCVSIGAMQYSQVGVTVNGTYAGVTIVFEFSDDGGLTWYAGTCTRSDMPIQLNADTLPSNTTRAYDCGISGSTNFRVRASAYSSGTVNLGLTRTAVQIEPAPTTQAAGMGYTAITTSTNTQIKSTPVFVHTIVISQPGATANSIAVVDTTAANCSGGTTLLTIPTAQLTSGMAPNTITLDIVTSNGLCITTAGTTPPQLLVTWR